MYMVNFKYLFSFLAALLLTGKLLAATFINTPTVSGVWTVQNSPYYIENHIVVLEGDSLQIRPGVAVIFMGNYKIDARGYFSAIGTMDEKIIFKANDTTGWHNRNTPDGGWAGIEISNFNNPDFGRPALEHCIIRDLKDRGTWAISTHGPNMFINHCDFYHNYTRNLLILKSASSSDTKSKLKFTNNRIYDNYSIDNIISTRYVDSTIFSNNKCYNNEAGYGIFEQGAIYDTVDHVFLFEQNEMYHNTVEKNTGILNVLPGGHAYIRNNKIHHNSTTLKAAVNVTSKTAVIEQNLIVNNRREQKNGYFCGTGEGGAGLLLLGPNVLQDKPGMGEYIVRNNIIANNYSDISGAGIWAQHCKATIVNNTIVNNTALQKGAGVYGMGAAHCKLKIYNNILQGNELTQAPADKVNHNFQFFITTVDISDNLLDYAYTNPWNGTNYPLNLHDTNIVLSAPTTGAGPAFDALVADFGPVASSLNVIDKGNIGAPDYGTLDFYGNARVINGRIDMGAIESREVIDTATGIKAQQLAGRISLYPVPAKQNIHVTNNTGRAIKNVQLYNIQGQQYALKYEGTGTGLLIDLDSRPAGNYYLQLLLGDGQTIHKAFIID